MNPIVADSENATQALQNGIALTGTASSVHSEGEPIEQSVRRRLQCSPYPEIGKLDVSFDNGSVTLRGTLPSYFLKQLAQELAKGIPDVESVRNECIVAASGLP